MLCVPDHMGEAASDRLLRNHVGMHRFAWPDDPTIEFHLGHGDWIRLLRGCGLLVEDLIEIAAPAEATSRYDFVTAEWARRWPCEEVWRARKAGPVHLPSRSNVRNVFMSRRPRRRQIRSATCLAPSSAR
jgi:hypothetical protein